MKDYINWVVEKHDVGVNQKYDGKLPYSFHLEQVVREVKRFKHLLTPEEYFIALHVGWGHDLMEDARMTYNDVKNLGYHIGGSSLPLPEQLGMLRSNPQMWVEVADAIYCVTDEKGKNRKQRKSDKYYSELTENKIAVFVKICDIIANSKYSNFSESDMFDNYREEFPRMESKIYRDEFKEMFDYLKKILEL